MEKEPRVKFFAFYPDDFLEDARVIELANEDQQLWLMLIIKMFRYQGIIPDSHQFIARLLGISVNRAAKLKQTLLACSLLVYEGQQLLSRRLRAEYEKSRSFYQKKSDNGKKGAETRWNKEGAKVIDFPRNDE